MTTCSSSVSFITHQALFEGDLRPLYRAIAAGTADGPEGLTPFDYYVVPPPTAAELEALGYPPDEARAAAGGPAG